MLIGNTISLVHPIWIGASGMLPTGAAIPFFGPVSEVPTGYLVIDGSEASRIGEAALFAIIGTTYGAGNGTTTFNLPDARALGLIGVNDSTLPNGESGSFSTRALGATGGAETHQLAVSELPAHSHGYNEPSNVIQASSGTDVNNVGAIVAGTTTSTGMDAAHNNMQPFLTCNWIIKT